MEEQFKRLIAGVALVSACALSWAGGGLTGGATEMTQLMNNVQLVKVAIDQASSASTLLQQYTTQIKQLGLQQLNIQNLAGLPAGLTADTASALGKIQNYQAALDGLRGTLSVQLQMMDQRLTEAQLYGRSEQGWQTYATRVQQDIQSGNQLAKLRAQQEQAALSQVQQDYQYARTVQSQIPSTIGQQQSLQLLNAQMNRIVTQNAKIIEVLSTTLAKDAAANETEARKKAQDEAVLQQVQTRSDAIRQRQQGFGGTQ